MLTEHEDSLQKSIKTHNLGSVFIPCGDGVEGQVTVNKVWESALHASACQYAGMGCGTDPEQSVGKVNYADH